MSHNKRVWLNSLENSSTGAIVCYSGLSNWADGDGNREIVHFVKMSDCHCKVRLHCGKYDTKDEYVDKLKLMRDTINEYIEYLENNSE